MLKPSAVLIHLRRDGVIAHLAVFSPLVGSRIVVFLEANAGQQELAAASVRRMPGVAGVSFPSDTNAIMYVKLGVS